MKIVNMVIFTVIIIIASLAQVGGQTVTNTLPERLPIADMKSVEDWAITNTWKTSVYVHFQYQGSSDTNQWGGNVPWLEDIQFPSYSDYENYLQTRGMYFMERFKIETTDHKSLVKMIAPVGVNIGDKLYFVLDIRADLGTLDSITADSFKNLPQTRFGAIIPVKGLTYFNIKCGVPGVWPEQFWYTWHNGASSLSWGGPKDYAADTDMLILDSKLLLATQRIRFTVIANGLTAVYTQHGDKLGPASVKRSGDKIVISFPLGADVAIETSSDLKSWKSAANLPWNYGTNFISFPINPSVAQCYYRASVQ